MSVRYALGRRVKVAGEHRLGVVCEVRFTAAGKLDYLRAKFPDGTLRRLTTSDIERTAA